MNLIKICCEVCKSCGVAVKIDYKRCIWNSNTNIFLQNKLTEGIVDLSLMEGLGHQYYDPHYFTRTESGTKPV